MARMPLTQDGNPWPEPLSKIPSEAKRKQETLNPNEVHARLLKIPRWCGTAYYLLLTAY